MKMRFVLLLLISAIGTLFRFYDLGGAALRADTIMFWNLCRNVQLTPGHLYTGWLNIVGETGQFPTAVAMTRLWLDLTGLPVTEWSLRFPNALLGALSVPLIFMGARLIGGGGFGLFCALLLALNPFHIQASREVYFYSMLMPGSCLLLWSAIWAVKFRRSARWPLRFYLGSLAGVALSAHSHLSGCWLVMIWGAITGGVGIYRLFRMRPAVVLREIGALFGPAFLIGLPLLMMPWAAPVFIKGILNPQAKEQIQTTMGLYDGNLFRVIRHFVLASGWGSSPVRAVWTGLLTILTLLLAILPPRRLSRQTALLMFAAGAVILHFSSLAQGTPPNLRYLFFVQPALLVMLSLPLSVFWIRRRMPVVPAAVRHVLRYTFMATALLLQLGPAWASVTITGKPTPYKAIQRWADTRVPPGTLILTDRWFEPWNELAVYSSTNAFFVFTVPDEPVENFIKLNWRQTVIEFFEKNPDAVFMEIAKNHWNKLEVGPWVWPAGHFANHEVITNRGGLVLRRYGTVFREDFLGHHTNRVAVDVYWDTREDVLKKALREGRDVVRFFGEGWGYAKPGWQQGHFEDYRILKRDAAIELHNLKEVPLSGTLEISAATADKPKTVSVNGATTGFASGRIRTWTVPLTLQPGKKTIPFTSPSVDPLFVLDIRWKPAQP
jgi:hypothetical protein